MAALCGRIVAVVDRTLGGDLWRSASRPAVLPHCIAIALPVGTLLTLVNDLDALIGARPDGALAFRVAANFLVPFVVSNLGAMLAFSADR